MRDIVRHAAVLTLSLASLLHAQSGSSIARRVAQAPNGEVRLTYTSRPTACGDGRDVVSIGEGRTVLQGAARNLLTCSSESRPRLFQ